MAIIPEGLNRTPLVDDDGRVTREWNIFLRNLGSGGTSPFAVVVPVSFSATPTFDCSLSNGRPVLFTMTLTGNVTASTIANATSGQEIYFKLTEDGTGGRTFVWDAAALNAPLVDTTAGAITTAGFVFDGAAFGAMATPSVPNPLKVPNNWQLQIKNGSAAGYLVAVSDIVSGGIDNLIFGDPSLTKCNAVVDGLNVSLNANTSSGFVILTGSAVALRDGGANVRLQVGAVSPHVAITGDLSISGTVPSLTATVATISTIHASLIDGGNSTTSFDIGSPLTISPGGTTRVTVQSSGTNLVINGSVSSGKFTLGSGVTLDEQTVGASHYINAVATEFRVFDVTGSTVNAEFGNSGASWGGGSFISSSSNVLLKNSVNFGPAAVASITVVNGQITAIS